MTWPQRVFLLALALLVAAPLQAQEANIESGLTPYATFQGGDVDLVNLTNGNLTVRIPIRSYPQRGGELRLNFLVSYDHQGFQAQVICPFSQCTWIWYSGPTGPRVVEDQRLWVTRNQLICPYPSCSRGQSVFVYVAHADDGAEHELVDLGSAGARSTDATGLYADTSTYSQGTSIVFERNGIRHFWDGALNSSWEVWREDRNGNQILRSTAGWLDSVGRTIPAAVATSDYSGCTGPLSTVSASIWNLPGPEGGTSQVKFCYADVAVETNIRVVGGNSNQFKKLVRMLQSVVLPNATAWTFEYNSRDPGDPANINYGELTKITLPTGGTISYVWSPEGLCTSSTYYRRSVISRTVNANDGSGSRTWTYQYLKATNGEVLVKDPLGTETVHAVPDLGVATQCSKYVTRTQWYQGLRASGTLLKTETTDFYFTTDPLLQYKQKGEKINIVPIRTTTTWPNGQVGKVEKDYDSGFFDSYGTNYLYGNVVATREYDYGGSGPGSLVRKTEYAYLALSNSTYRSLNLLDLLSSVRVRDGASVQKAYTIFGYDESGLQPSGVTTQRNPSPATGTFRGNQTSLGRWLNTTGTYITTQSTFLDTGLVYQETDPGGHTTTFQYSNTYAGAFPTTVTNHLGHITSNSYDLNTGLLSATTDPNGQTTAFTYDFFDRLLAETRPPGGGATTWGFNDAGKVATKTQTIGPGVSPLVMEYRWEGLGRVFDTRLTSDPQGTTYTKVEHDGLGHTKKRWNPTRCFPPEINCGEPTWGATEFVYDALGRVTKVIPPDGTATSNHVATLYSGNATTVTDQAGKQRRGFTDALGRLVEVHEPAPGSGTAGTGSATVSGMLQSTGGTPATAGTGSVSISGSPQSVTVQEQVWGCVLWWEGGCFEEGWTTQDVTYWDYGGVSITVNDLTKSVSYDSGSTSEGIASQLANAFDSDPASPVTASASGNVVNLTSKVTGAVSNYPLSATSWTDDPAHFSQPSFSATPSGPSLTGGANAQPGAYDSGSVWVTVNGFQATASYGQGSTPASLAGALANVFNTNPASPVTASVSGTTVNVVAKTTGASTNYSLSGGSSTNQPATFPQPSFQVAVSGPTLTGGADPVISLGTPAVTAYTYDTLDNLTCVVQKGTDSAAFTSCGASPATWRPRSFTYNSLSQLLSATNPESGAIAYTYDNDGDLLTKTDARSITTTFTYDELHRLKKKAYSDTTPLIRYSYDGVAYEGCSSALSAANGIGRRTALCDVAGSESWAYDAMGRALTVRRTTNSVTKDFSYSYNFDGSLATLTYPTGRVITYSYNAAARLLSAVETAGGINYATGASYATAGSLASLTNGASTVSTYFYNSRLQPCRIHVRSSGTSPSNCDDLTQTGNVLDFRYGFNSGTANNGNVVSIENRRDATRTQSFTYDELNRIDVASTSVWSQNHDYDIWGNLHTITAGGATALCVTVSASNRLSQTCAGGTTFGYDAAGNMTWDGSYNYSYDGENRIKTTAGVTYTYDGDGKRVQKSNGKLYWYGVSSDPLLETDLAGNNPTEFVFFNGKRIARRDSSGTVSYFFADHLGSSRVVTNATGTIVEDSDFYPFGGERVVTDTLSDQNYKFTGKERDGESGLDYFVARYYSSGLGRFVSPDEFPGGPVDAFSSNDPAPPGALPYADITNPQSLNKYSYAYNNPIIYVDPDGHNPFLVAAIIGLAWAALEAGSAIYDVKTAIETVQDPGVTTTEKVITTGLAATSVVAPGGGYATAFRFSRGLGGKIGSIFRKVDHIIAKELDAKTVEAARRELAGGVVAIRPKTGKAFDHVTKVEQGIKGLKSEIQKLQGLVASGKLSPKAKEAVQRKLSEASKKLDEVEQELKRKTKV